MKYLLIISFLMLPTLAMAQEDGVDPVTECAAALASPPFVDILTRDEGRDFSEISSRSSGRSLVGLECSVFELTEFFKNTGWGFLRFEERSLVGPLGGRLDGDPKYYVDASAFYCLKRPTIWRFFPRCRPTVTISFHEGRISRIAAHVSK